MITVDDAAELAGKMLAETLPRRWRHVRSVARRARWVAKELALSDDLVAAAWLHDIGYAPDLVETGFPPLDGARYLRRMGVDESVVGLVAYHSCARLSPGRSVRTVQVMKTVLSSALSRAMREELVVRNVARLAELPTWERKPITPWSAAEARAFLDAAKKDPLYPAFMLLLLYGLRRGEVLGLRWRDVDEEDGEICIRQQVQRIKGELRFYPIKTAAGRRDLPLLPIVQSILDLRRQAQTADRQEFGRAWQDNGLIVTTKTGRPVEPRNLVRSFHRICDTYNSATSRSIICGTPPPPCSRTLAS